MPTSATRKTRKKSSYKNNIKEPKASSSTPKAQKKPVNRPEQKRKASNNYGVARRTFGV